MDGINSIFSHPISSNLLNKGIHIVSASVSIKSVLSNQYTYTGPNPASAQERMEARIDRLALRTIHPFYKLARGNQLAMAAANAALKNLKHPLSWNIAQKLR